MTSVLIADDHAMYRIGLRHVLEDIPGISKVGEAASGNEVLDKLRTDDWDLLLLDINMPDRSGLDVLRHVRAGHERTRILIMSGYPEREYAINAIRAGASGFVPKSGDAEELTKAVRLVLQGRRYVSENLAELLVSDLDKQDKPLHAALSEREFQIFGKLAAGATVTAIAHELCLSVKTVSSYRARILEKLHFKSNAELTSYALRNEIIQ